jgi:hypothetical protein
VTAQERLDQGLYTPDASGIVGIYEDLVDLSPFEWSPGYTVERDAATKILGYIQKVHNSKGAQISLAIEAIGKAVSDYSKAMSSPKGVILAKESHVWPIIKQNGEHEYPKLSLIAKHWQECVQKSRAVDMAQANRAAQIEGREKFATQAEYARMTDMQKAEEHQRLKGSRDYERTQLEMRLAGYDTRYPELAPKVRAYCMAKWKSRSVYWLLVTYERATDPYNRWEIPTPKQVRDDQAGYTDIAPLDRVKRKVKG